MTYKAEIGDRVEVICYDHQGSIGVVTDITDLGDYRGIDVDLLGQDGIINSDVFHDGELKPAKLN